MKDSAKVNGRLLASHLATLRMNSVIAFSFLALQRERELDQCQGVQGLLAAKSLVLLSRAWLQAA